MRRRLSEGGAGVSAALASAVLFGASAFAAKALVSGVQPIVLAALLYVGSGAGLGAFVLVQLLRRKSVPTTVDKPSYLVGATVTGGMVAPVLLMLGLARINASTASLLLNTEGVFTAGLAWFVFHENFNRRVAVGMLAILAGAIMLSWSGKPDGSSAFGALLVVAACCCWAIDNNLTHAISGSDSVQIAAIKGLAAGGTNLLLALVLRQPFPAWQSIGFALIVGFLGYGVSLVLFVQALRRLGTARTGAYFSTAPFIGAALSVLILHEPLTLTLIIAGALMGLGVWLHLTETHDHQHLHDVLIHTHSHSHGDHHQHSHGDVCEGDTQHVHLHTHPPILHRHPHYPDIHHRHGHTE